MSIRLLFALYAFCFHTAAGQTVKAYPVKAGEIPNEVLPKEAIYLFDGFKEGTAWFKNGTSTVKQFNYNFLLDEMHFISGERDTLAIADPILIKSIAIDSVVFYYQKGYLREIYKAGMYILAVREEMQQFFDKTRGGYDVASGASSIKTYESINNFGQRYQLQVKKDVLFQKVISFYVGDPVNPLLKATKKNFHILFPEKDITKYSKDHKLNFNIASDLNALLMFCVQ